MPQKKWTLLDQENGVYLEHFETSETVRCSCEKTGKKHSVEYRITKQRLYGGVQDGVDVITVDNGRLSFTICPTRGLGVLSASCDGLQLKWDSPARGPVHPQFVPLSDPSGLGWLDGFSEWIVRCGLESNGAPEFLENGNLQYPLHGRIANIPARKVELLIDTETGEIKLRGVVNETRMFFRNLQLEVEFTTKFGSSEFVLTDKVTNLSAKPGEFELLYHINTGMPFVTPGSKIHVPFEKMVPRNQDAASELDHWFICDPESPESNEVVYFFEPAGDKNGNCQTLLVGEQGEHALSVGFNTNEFPYFCLWKCRLAQSDGYVIGLEPCVNFPNNRSYEKEQGRVVPLKPGESRSFNLKFSVLCGSKEVTTAIEQVVTLHKGATGMIEKSPKSGWGP